MPQSGQPSGTPSSPPSATPPGDAGQGESDAQVLAEAMDVFREAQRQRGDSGDGDAADGEPGDAAGELDDSWMEGSGSGDDTWPTEADTASNTPQDAEDPSGAPPGATPADGEGAPGGTLSDLERELEEAMQDFDGQILAERGRILARANEGAGDRELPPAGTPGDGDSAGGPPPGGNGEGEPGMPPQGEGGEQTGRSTSGGGYMPDLPSAPPPGRVPTTARTSSVPADIPDGSDDDVVARQLREAAMNEPDPELRERLWDEYRKYKEATGS